MEFLYKTIYGGNKMNSFLEELTKLTDMQHLTENGAIKYDTTRNALLDLFAETGALRRRSEEEIKHLFEKAFIESPELATKMAFYTRDVREALGERRTGRIMFEALANTHPDIMAENVKHIAEFGR